MMVIYTSNIYIIFKMDIFVYRVLEKDGIFDEVMVCVK